MSLEILSNELFLEIFEYLSTVHLFQSFSTLNLRLTNLLTLHFQTHGFNLQSSSKYHFDRICGDYLPSILDRITSLRLSDDDDTPNQINHFFSLGVSFRSLIYLKSLSIHRFSSFNYWKTILNELHHLPHLIHLTITRHIILFNEEYDIEIIDCINRLSNLVFCHLDITNDSECCFSTPAIHSTSLKYLSLPYLECTSQQLVTFIQHTTNLQTLVTRVSNPVKILPSLPVCSFPLMKTLKLTFDGSFESIRNLLSIMPNLVHLKINILSSYINGYQWEDLISNHLSHLTTFHMKMSTFTITKDSRDEEINKILQSFQNSFWLEEHQWYIQCYYSTLKSLTNVHVYTLPYSFPDLFYLDDAQVKSTCSKNNQSSFDRVKNLYYSSNLSKRISPIYLNRIRYLYLSFPFDHLLQSILSKFDRLETLQIILVDRMTENDITKLQSLLDQTNNLRFLALSSWISQQIFPLELRNPSIHHLDLRGLSISYSDQFCEQLTRSPIVQQCQTLSLNLHQPLDIVQLIDRLTNLQSLIIRCADNKRMKTIIEFLQSNSISPSLTSNIEEIRLWIR